MTHHSIRAPQVAPVADGANPLLDAFNAAGSTAATPAVSTSAPGNPLLAAFNSVPEPTKPFGAGPGGAGVPPGAFTVPVAAKPSLGARFLSGLDNFGGALGDEALAGGGKAAGALALAASNFVPGAAKDAVLDFANQKFNEAAANEQAAATHDGIAGGAGRLLGGLGTFVAQAAGAPASTAANTVQNGGTVGQAEAGLGTDLAAQELFLALGGAKPGANTVLGKASNLLLGGAEKTRLGAAFGQAARAAAVNAGEQEAQHAITPDITPAPSLASVATDPSLAFVAAMAALTHGHGAIAAKGDLGPKVEPAPTDTGTPSPAAPSTGDAKLDTTANALRDIGAKNGVDVDAEAARIRAGGSEPTAQVPQIANDHPVATIHDTDHGPVAEPTPEASQPEPAPEDHATADNPVREVPLRDITGLDADVPQFKKGASETGEVEPLQGDFDRRGLGPIQLWQRNDGSMTVISGRHRYQHALRTGQETIPAQVYREADGFTKQQAASLDAELNIRDGQGSVADYAQYFQSNPAFEGAGGHAEAESRGLLARATGRRAYAIASKGDAELVAAHRAGQVTDEQAVQIAQAAPNDQALQTLGMQRLQQGDTLTKAVNVMRAAKSIRGDRPAQQGDIFGLNDSGMRDASAMADAAAKRQREIGQRLAAISGAAKRPEVARAEGIDVHNPDAVRQRIAELRAERDSWENWETDPAKVAQLRSEAGLEPTSGPATQKPVQSAPQRDDAATGLFPAPTAGERNRAAAEAKDAARNGRVGGREDTGDGGLFDGPRPEQVRIPDRQQGKSVDEVREQDLSPEDQELVRQVRGRSQRAQEDRELGDAMQRESAARGEQDAHDLGLKATVDAGLGANRTAHIHYVHDEDGLPAEVRARGTPIKEGNVRYGLHTSEGDIYIFTKNANTPARALWTAWHENGHEAIARIVAAHPDVRVGSMSAAEAHQRAREMFMQNPTVANLARVIAEQRGSKDLPRMAEEAMVELKAARETGDWGAIKRKYGIDVPESMRPGVGRAMDNFVRRIKAILNAVYARISGDNSKTFTDADALSFFDAMHETGRGERGLARDSTGGVEDQQVFHGTPHRGIEAEGFNLNKIGTGEGNQAYGWGVYFAGRRDVAERYRTMLTRDDNSYTVDGNTVKVPRFDTAPYRAANEGRLREYIDDQRKQIQTERAFGHGAESARVQALQRDLLAAESLVGKKVHGQGQLYHAEIPEDHELLDWDKPLAEQPEKVKSAIRELAQQDTPAGRRMSMLLDSRRELTGSRIYKELSTWLNRDGSRGAQLASEALRDAGIPGLRYLDGGSRGNGEGSHNYVIWDESRLNNDVTPYYSEEPADAIGDVVRAARELGNASTKARVARPQSWLSRMAAKFGLNVDGFSHVIDSSAVRHIRKEHTGPDEQRRGQVPVEDADYVALPRVVAEPDKVIFGTKNRIGRDQIGYLKRMPDGQWLYFKEARTGNRELAAQSLRKYPATMDAEAVIKTIRAPDLNARGDGGNGLIVEDGPVVGNIERDTNDGVATDKNVAGNQEPRAAGGESRRDAEYRAPHRPADKDLGARLDDLTSAFSDDIYWPNAAELHGHGISADRKAMEVINRARGKPESIVTVYRAVPKDASNAIQPGDWVTLTREYARDHGDGPLGGDYKIISAKVPAGELFNEGNSIHEFGYRPNDRSAPDRTGADSLESSEEPADRALIPRDDVGTERRRATDNANVEPPNPADEPPIGTPRAPGESLKAYDARIIREGRESMLAGVMRDHGMRLLDAEGRATKQVGRGMLRAYMAGIQRTQNAAEQQFKAAMKVFDGFSRRENLDAIHQWETKQDVTSAPHRLFFAVMDKAFKERIEAIRKIDPEALQSLIENYFPHLWKDPTRAAKWYASQLARRPLQGDRAFLKQRVYATIREGMASGLEPISANPVDLLLGKLTQMDKFIAFGKLRGELDGMGWLPKLKNDERVPYGYARVENGAFNGVVVPETLAKDINNYLSPGFNGNKAFRALRWTQNTLTMAQLGWSGFHAGFTTFDNAVLHAEVGLRRALMGDFHGAVHDWLHAPLSIVASPIEGGALNRSWVDVASGAVDGKFDAMAKFFGVDRHDVNTLAILDALEQGGARWKMSRSDYTNDLNQFLRAFRQKDVKGSLQHALGAFGEAGSFYIHHVLVPNQKMAARVLLAKYELDRLAGVFNKHGNSDVSAGNYKAIIDAMHPTALRQVMGKVVHDVDSRLGQMAYDNLFWNRSIIQIGQTAFRALGWQIGTVGTVTGGVRDLRRLWSPEKLLAPLDKGGKITDADMGRVTGRTSYLLTLAIVSGMSNALLQYALTGQAPSELKDYFFPRTGRKNSDGSDERLQLPSYWMDHWKIASHPLQTLGHKINPLFELLAEPMRNQNFWGAQIRDPHAKWDEQAAQLGKYWAAQFLPFTFSNGQKVAENGGKMGRQIANFFGVTNAPASVTRSDFQAFVGHNGNKGFGHEMRSQVDLEHSRAVHQAEAAIRQGDTPDMTGMTPRDRKRIAREVRSEVPELEFRKMDIEDKLQGWDMATPKERVDYNLRRNILLTAQNAIHTDRFMRLPEDQRQAIYAKLREIRNQPTAGQ